jgi:RNA polymerase sigma factor (TIGR02999 family)
MPENATETSSLSGEAYARLRALAASFLSRERRDHTLQPTALANEAFLRLSRVPGLGSMGRDELLAAASTAMRRVLVDHARRRRATKRGADGQRVPLDEALTKYEAAAGDLLELDRALEQLEAEHPRLARIVDLRFFGGLTEEQVGAALGVSDRTVRRDWTEARSWLAQRLRDDQ